MSTPDLAATVVVDEKLSSVAPQNTRHMLKTRTTLLHSGILMTAISAVLLNLYFNGIASLADAEEFPRANAHGGEQSA